jgi:hypothetical protein
MYGASNSQSIGNIAQSISQGKNELAGGIARLAMSPGGSYRSWARA